ncbi:MAG: hypothetical protein MUF61_01215 [archaeon]|jgi:uncharacterized protein (UPF0333 family)|nr:hypothetical protein [archaeon]
MMKKRAQGWGFDLMIAIIIFLSAIIAFYYFSMSSTNESEQYLDSLNYDAANIAESFLSEGSPADWNSTHVFKIGVLSNLRINETKLLNFKIIADSDYYETKNLLNSKHDYSISFSENITINGTAIEYIGALPSNPQNLIKATRLATYRERPLSVYVSVWN